jgi:hypothetical protein
VSVVGIVSSSRRVPGRLVQSPEPKSFTNCFVIRLSTIQNDQEQLFSGWGDCTNDLDLYRSGSINRQIWPEFTITLLISLRGGYHYSGYHDREDCLHFKNNRSCCAEYRYCNSLLRQSPIAMILSLVAACCHYIRCDPTLAHTASINRFTRISLSIPHHKARVPVFLFSIKHASVSCSGGGACRSSRHH